jgi:hypothetical protein
MTDHESDADTGSASQGAGAASSNVDPVVRVSPDAGRRNADQVRALLARAGLREQADAEAQEVAALLMHRFAHDVSGDEEAATDELEVRSAFLRHRFIDPVMAYQRGDRFYSYLDTVLNLTSIAAGIGASLTAALVAPKGWTIILGVVIAGCQTFSQWLKPSQRAARRGQAASDLRSESWNLLQRRDRYRGKSVNHAWNIFCDQVDKVEDREEAAEDKESGQGLSSSNADASPG